MSDIINIENQGTIPILPIHGMPIFPSMVMHFDVDEDKSLYSVQEALIRDKKIFAVAQTDPTIDFAQKEDLYTIGTICTIKQVLHADGKGLRILIEGICRAKLIDVTRVTPFYECIVEKISYEKNTDEDYVLKSDTYLKMLKACSARYFSHLGRIPEEINASFAGEKDCEKFADILAGILIMSIEDKQQLMEEFDVLKRLEILYDAICHDLKVFEYEKEITAKTKKNIDKNQREYYLQEQLKIIREELGDAESNDAEVDKYCNKIAALDIPSEVEEKLAKELSKLSKTQYSSPETAVIRNYIDYVLELPWGKKSKENEDLNSAKDILDSSHYGLQKVKERIMEFLAIRKLSKGEKSPVICLVGPPGVGKTSIAKAVAESLGREYVRMSLGGIHDEAEIRGHRRTYIGSMPGRIASAVKLAGTFNPLILLDEIDKVGADYRGNVGAALLEVLDTKQNFSFRDHYLEFPLDLSDVMFFTTANSLDTIDRPLLDRMEIIELSGYTDDEKLHIATDYIIPRQIKENGLKKSNIRISDGAILDIIHFYTKESGVRELERKIAAVMRKTAYKTATENKKSMTVSSKNLEKILGHKIYDEPTKSEKSKVGVATGLAWTQYGGDTLSVEVNVMDGEGNIELTGQLGDVMKESAKAAISYIRANSKNLGVASDFYSKKDLHIHIPEGAVPKDGPSAGITMATAIVSALTGKKVSKDVAMTGEITITGRILPIGGLKEKALAAYRAGIKTILIPKENVADTYDLPEQIRKDINFEIAESMDKVLSTALID